VAFPQNKITKNGVKYKENHTVSYNVQYETLYVRVSSMFTEGF